MKIKLLTPISHLFNEDDNKKNISDLSDELEARERTYNLKLDNTTHYHIDFDINIGITKDQIDFLYNHVKPRENIQTLTFQAARDCEEIFIKNKKYFPNSKPLSIKDQIENTKNSLKIIKDIIGTNREIGIENNNFYPTGAYEFCTSPDFLIPCYEYLGLHLLFDVAHAIVTSTNKNIIFDDYKDALLSNMECKQIHLCEPTYTYLNQDANAVDSHNIPTPKSTKDTLEIMKKWKIEYLTIEYYRDATILKEYLNYLKSIILKF